MGYAKYERLDGVEDGGNQLPSPPPLYMSASSSPSTVNNVVFFPTALAPPSHPQPAACHPSVMSTEVGGKGFVELHKIAPQGYPKKLRNDMRGLSLYVATEAVVYAIRQNAQSGLSSVSLMVDAELAPHVCDEVVKRLPLLKRIGTEQQGSGGGSGLKSLVVAFW